MWSIVVTLLARSARPYEGAGIWSSRTLPFGNSSLSCTTARSGRSWCGSTEPSGFSFPAACAHSLGGVKTCTLLMGSNQAVEAPPGAMILGTPFSTMVTP